ncbi:MAG: Phospho-N-acetylmuramoyl-pentapeptide-transferase, partial [Verrucomicrobiota bacterium]
MLYYLHFLSGYGTGAETEIFKGLNVFQYITFRSLAAGVTAFILCLIFGNRVIRRLVSLKLGQPIRTQEEVNRLHELHGAKAGTPTMGGTLLLGAVIVSTLLWARPTNPLVWLCLFTVFFLGGLGFVDDYLKVTKKSSDGISSRLKFALQCLLAAVLTGYFLFDVCMQGQPWTAYVPFAKDPVINL